MQTRFRNATPLPQTWEGFWTPQAHFHIGAAPTTQQETALIKRLHVPFSESGAGQIHGNGTEKHCTRANQLHRHDTLICNQ